MHRDFFKEFSLSGDSLQVYEDDELLFSSGKEGLLPLLEYIDRFGTHHQQVVIFDKIMGNAAALLCAQACCREVYSPVGSRLAIRTLERYGIKYHLTELVPYIQKPGGQDACPMETLSLNKRPEEFYQLMKNIIT